MKEDVLEQIVDDYLQLHGYFTIHNVRFRPTTDHSEYNSSQDSVRSDVDVVGINPKKRGFERVWVVSCKAWQGRIQCRANLETAKPKGAARQARGLEVLQRVVGSQVVGGFSGRDRSAYRVEQVSLLDRGDSFDRRRCGVEHGYEDQGQSAWKPIRVPDVGEDVD